MAKLTLIEAAKLYGKSRVTLYRHARKGTLAAEKRTRGGKGTYVVDMAELVRCYGEPPPDNVAGIVADATPATTPVTDMQAEIAALNERLRAAESKARDAADQVAWLRNQVEVTQRLLVDKSRARGIVGMIRRVLVGDKP